MKRLSVGIVILMSGSMAAAVVSAQVVVVTSTPVPKAQQRLELFGIKLRPEVAAVVKEIETKTRKPIYADFDEQPEFQLGASYIDEDGGMAVLTVDPALEDDPKKLEAVFTHELLHLRLTVNGYPSYLWSPKVRTAKGLAIDVAQGHINLLRNLVEHRLFRADMIKWDLYRYVDLAGDTLAESRKHKGKRDGQTETLNYVRAVLEYSNPKDTAAVRQVYITNGWHRALADGSEIAAIIDNSVVLTPADIESVFLKCVSILYPPPGKTVSFTLTKDATSRYFRRLILNIERIAKK